MEEFGKVAQVELGVDLVADADDFGEAQVGELGGAVDGVGEFEGEGGTAVCVGGLSAVPDEREDDGGLHGGDVDGGG